MEGPDAQELTIPPAPRFDSEQTAHEAGELYWMAVLRDLPFVSYATDGTAQQAIASLNNEFPRFGGTVPVTAQNLFRGIYPGEQVGPYVSQFLVKGNVDPRKPAGQGRDAVDGFISYGARTIDQRLFPAVWDLDYLTTFSAWLNAQNGVDTRGGDQFDTAKRFIHNLRGGATFVHFDQVIDAFYNAAWILMSEPTGNQLDLRVRAPTGGRGVPQGPGQPVRPAGNDHGLPHAGRLRHLRPHPPPPGAGRGPGPGAAGRVVPEVVRAPAPAPGGVRRARAQPRHRRAHLPAARQHRHLAPERWAGAVLRKHGGEVPLLVPAAPGVPRGGADAPGVRRGARDRLRGARHHAQGVLRRDAPIENPLQPDANGTAWWRTPAGTRGR